MRVIIGKHFYFHIVIKLFKKFKCPFVNKKVVAKIILLARGPRYREKPTARASNQIAENHNITLVVHK